MSDEDIDVKYPEAVVEVRGAAARGNVTELLGLCVSAAIAAGVPDSEVTFFVEVATHPYTHEHAMKTAREWFTVT